MFSKRNFVYFVFLFAMIFSPALHAGIWDQIKSAFFKAEKPKPPTIKVLIHHDVDAAQIEVKGKHVIYDPFTNERLAYRSDKTATIRALPTGIKWGEEFPKRYQVLFVPESKGAAIIVNGVEYRGSIAVYAIDLDRISIVNHVDIEDYLFSTLGNNLSQPYSIETLASLTIAARTQAYYQSVSSANSYWHVAADQVGYKGAYVVPSVPEINHAILATRYMVLSQTGIYEGVITPFPIQLVFEENNQFKGKSRGFSVEEAESFAKQGDNAPKILHRVFPNTTIELAYNPGNLKLGEEVANRK